MRGGFLAVLLKRPPVIRFQEYLYASVVCVGVHLGSIYGAER